MALHGDKLLARIGALVQAGTLDPAGLPRIVALRAANDLDDYTPWPHAALRPGAPDFGGGAERFLRGVVEPLACGDLRCSTLLGYSLSGLFALFALQKSNAFDTVLIASPSSWYPDFVESFDTKFVNSDTRMALACGEDEGRNHPSPIDSTRACTDLLVGRLDEALRTPCTLMLDEGDHHRGLDLRLERLLTWYAAQ